MAYVITDAGREYWTGSRWTPASDQAMEYETHEEAAEALDDTDRSTARVVEID